MADNSYEYRWPIDCMAIFFLLPLFTSQIDLCY